MPSLPASTQALLPSRSHRVGVWKVTPPPSGNAGFRDDRKVIPLPDPDMSGPWHKKKNLSRWASTDMATAHSRKGQLLVRKRENCRFSKCWVLSLYLVPAGAPCPWGRMGISTGLGPSGSRGTGAVSRIMAQSDTA